MVARSRSRSRRGHASSDDTMATRCVQWLCPGDDSMSVRVGVRSVDGAKEAETVDSSSDSDSSEVLPIADVAELFSPPRLTLVAWKFGLSGGSAFDLLCNHDLATIAGRASVWAYVKKFKPRVLVTSAPCTMYSALYQLWNRAKMNPATYQRRRAAANSLLSWSMTLCRHQHDTGNFYLHEHPASADSWPEPAVQAIAALPGAFTSTFDQCVFGLVAPFTGEPCRKRTTFLHNMVEVDRVFGGRRCSCRVPHRKISSSLHGVKLSTYCQVYGSTL